MQTKKTKTTKKKKTGSKTKRSRRKSNRSFSYKSPSSTVKVAISFARTKDGVGLTQLSGPMTRDLVSDFVPDQKTCDVAITELEKLGFSVTSRGRLTFSVRCSRKDYEKAFGTKLSRFKSSQIQTGTACANSFYFPKSGAKWNPSENLTALIDDAYIQWPHIYMNNLFAADEPSLIPPQIDYHHLRVPGDVTLLCNATKVHRAGTTGKGVKVAMIDSGFAHGHPYFQKQGYNTATVLAPGATDTHLDGNGHGTGESANLLAIAPDCNFIGVKLDNENDARNGASILEGFQEAISHNPDVISVSLGFDLCPTDPQTGQRLSNDHLTALPNSLKALEAEIQAAVADGTVVVFSAGNGHVAFPGMMPGVISAGGVYVAQNGAMQASDYASAFSSKIYPGRKVPDFCGLVGLASNSADYIMLPIQSGCVIDTNNAQHDGTGPTDGWGVFSGTSAAAPQLAGICALLLQKNPGLTPTQVKQALRLTALDVINGNANPASNENNGGMPAAPGPDSATGSGLVDAFSAWNMV